MGFESRHSLVGPFVLGTLRKQLSRYQLRPESSSIGQDSFPSSCSSCQQNSVPRGLLDEGLSLTHCWPEATLTVFLTKCSSLPESRETVPVRQKSVFCNLISDVMSHHLGHTLFFRSKSLSPADSQGEGATQGCDNQEAGIVWSYLEICPSHFLL